MSAVHHPMIYGLRGPLLVLSLVIATITALVKWRAHIKEEIRQSKADRLAYLITAPWTLSDQEKEELDELMTAR